MKYTVIYETTKTGYSAYVPDLPGCIAAGSTRAEVERLIQSAVREHVRILRERSEPVPPPTTEHGSVAVGRR
jgi:predicted RNase H-like HicB family nuclease